MERILVLNKKIGETPLECVNRFRLSNPDYQDVPMTYAGRLDPMAEGVMVVLTGEECKKREFFLGLRKIYETQILIGAETDSYDLLGKVSSINEGNDPSIADILSVLSHFEGQYTQTIPPYSTTSWKQAREGTLQQDDLKKREVTLYQTLLLKNNFIIKDDLFEYIEKTIPLVTGDFRQEEILATWRESLRLTTRTRFPMITLKIECSSGTYIRALAHEIGTILGVGALAFSIQRTEVGS